MSNSAQQRILGAQGAEGKEVFEITPVILGGSPTDPANKVLLSRKEHVDAVRYWNRLIRKLREEAETPRQSASVKEGGSEPGVIHASREQQNGGGTQ